MDQNHFTTDTLRKKGAHLTFEERVIIQTRLRDKQSYRSIAREIGCCVNTVRNEVKRGKVLCYNGKVERYRAADGQSTYEAHRENCGRKCDAIAKGAFLDYVQKRLQEHHWSLDACFGRALVTGEFQRGEMVCTKTLYNYVTLGLLGKIKSIDLPLRVKRKNARKRVRERKKKFGRSIDERDPSVDERQDFGHWECDLVLGSRSKDEVLLTLVERKTRCSLIRKLPNKESASVIAAFRKLKDGMFRGCFSRVFLSITTDNGSEFSSRSLQVSDFLIKKERFYRSFLIRFVLPTCYKLKEFNYPIVYCHVYCIILLDSITYDFGSHGVLRMGTIISKKHGDRKYYYYVESARVNGNPRIVKQVYLGNADTILSKCKGQNESLQERALCSKIYSFGDVALLYSVARRAGIVPHIDTVLPKRGQGASIGTYLLVEAINRAVAPSSTVGLEKWYSSTCLPNFTGYTSRTFTPQNFWNNTCISAEELERADRSILSLLLSRYNLDTSHLIYDATNFFTYLNTNNPAALGQRGHSKEKRTNLKIVGLGVMIAADSGMPLLFDTYPGNRPDTKEFSVMLEKMMDRYTDIAGKKPELTVTFDRGNNSLENIRFLEQCSYPIHYVGGLTRQQMGALFDIPVDEYEPLADDRLSGCSAYRTKKVVFGREYTVVLVHNPKLMEGQLQGIRANIVKTDTKLSELQKNLLKRAAGRLKGGKTPTKESVTTKIESVLKAEYMRDIFDYAVTTDEAGHILLSYAQKENGLDDLCHKYLGKVALFTDNDQFSNERVVLSYRGAWKIESAFRQMKDISHLSVRPIFHWTDEKIRVHLFSCMLAYRLCIMAQLELKEKGISLSVQQMLEEMGNMKRVLTLFQDNKDIQYVNTYSQCSETADKVCEIMHLKDEFLTRG